MNLYGLYGSNKINIKVGFKKNIKDIKEHKRNS